MPPRESMTQQPANGTTSSLVAAIMTMIFNPSGKNAKVSPQLRIDSVEKHENGNFGSASYSEEATYQPTRIISSISQLLMQSNWPYRHWQPLRCALKHVSRRLITAMQAANFRANAQLAAHSGGSSKNR